MSFFQSPGRWRLAQHRHVLATGDAVFRLSRNAQKNLKPNVKPRRNPETLGTPCSSNQKACWGHRCAQVNQDIKHDKQHHVWNQGAHGSGGTIGSGCPGNCCDGPWWRDRHCCMCAGHLQPGLNAKMAFMLQEQLYSCWGCWDDDSSSDDDGVLHSCFTAAAVQQLPLLERFDLAAISPRSEQSSTSSSAA